MSWSQAGFWFAVASAAASGVWVKIANHRKRDASWIREFYRRQR